MKKIIYIGLIGIIIAGIAIICTIGLKADIEYSKNVQIEIYVEKQVPLSEIKEIAKEVFPDEKLDVQEVEYFSNMFAITLPEKSDEDLKEKIEQLNTKINEKYELENKTEDIEIFHNPKVRLSSLLKPYIIPMSISFAVIIVYIFIISLYMKKKYNKDISKSFIKKSIKAILGVFILEGLYLSILAITRFKINRYVIPIGLVLFIISIIIFGFTTKNKINKLIQEEK